MPNDKLKSYFRLHIIVFIWGFTAILGRLISLDALPLVWYRMSIAAFFLLGYVLIKKIPLKISKKVLIQFLFAGLIIAMHWFAFFKAIKVSNISVTLACLSTGAFFTSLLEPLLFGKKIVWYEVFFGIVAFLGLYIIFRVNGNYLEGIILALSAALLSGTFAIINSKFVKEHHPSLISLYELVGGVLFFSAFLFFTDGFNANFFHLSMNDFKYLLVLSSICTAYAFTASTSVMKHLSAYTVMLTINLEPIYGIILAVLFFGDDEKMNINFYIGAIIILTTVILNAILKNRKTTT